METTAGAILEGPVSNVDLHTVRTAILSKSDRSNAIIAGSLLADVGELAKELYRAMQYYQITVWMNANADVLYQPAGGAVDVIPQWIAGTYAFGACCEDIEADLLQLRAERRATGMIDD